ncbi:MAG: GlcNAc-PI de-N-acetylase [Peptococcaceae bacterium BRH_c4b]|nr:MAG: GlcNAc-PI de-N-acetylase [Peptococcaceae bacterium BRH_c4b]
MAAVLVVAPHPDDETIGCSGTIFRHIEQGYKVYWLIITNMKENNDYREIREKEINTVSKIYGFSSVYRLGFPTSELDTLPLNVLINSVSYVIEEIKPKIVYIPYRGDIHSDHTIVFDVMVASTKNFRHPYIKRILAYETISETDFNINPDNNGFRPNVFVDIFDYLDKKVEILNIYSSEVNEFPFPRSEKALRALATLRGVVAGFNAAEAFMLLKETL